MDDLGTRPAEALAQPVAEPQWRGLAATSIGCGAATLVATTTGSLVAGTAEGALALPLAVVALALSVAAIVLGVLAARHRSARVAGIVGIAVGTLANPALLAVLLGGAP